MVERTGTERLAALSDAVFAIAMTLLVIELKVPDLHGADVSRLGAELSAQTGSYLAYVLSFFVIGRAWLSHHRLTHLIAHVDEGLLRLNLVLLLFVAVLPFPTAVLGRYGGRTASVVSYAVCMTMLGALLTAIWWWARSRGLFAGEADRRDLRTAVLRPVSTAAVFLASIPVAFFSPATAMYMWVLVVVVPRLSARIWDRRGRHQRPGAASRAD